MLRLIVGGLLAIPPLLVTVLTAPVMALLSLPAAWCLLAHKKKPFVATSQHQEEEETNEIIKYLVLRFESTERKIE